MHDVIPDQPAGRLTRLDWGKLLRVHRTLQQRAIGRGFIATNYYGGGSGGGQKIPDFIFPSASLGSCNKRTALTDDIARCLQVHVRLDLASLVCFLVAADI